MFCRIVDVSADRTDVFACAFIKNEVFLIRPDGLRRIVEIHDFFRFEVLIAKRRVCSAIPVLVFEGTITLLARLVSPIMTDMAIFHLSLIGSVLIFCVGVNLVWGKTIRVANMLPAVVLAVLAAYMPWTF